MRLLFLSFILLASAVEISAQNSEKAIGILDKVSQAYDEAKGISATFSFSIWPEGEKNAEEFSGQVKMMGKKFVLQTSEVSTWYDGKNQWSFNGDSDEVNLTEPTEEELQSINPYLLMKYGRDKYTYKLVKENEKEAVIELKPRSADTDFKRVILTISLTEWRPITIEAVTTDNSRQKIVITNYRKNQNLADSLFVFDEVKYPDKEVIDLR